MAAENFTFNIAKGRGVQFYQNVDTNTPSGCALWLIPLAIGGTAAQGQDFDDVAAVLADANFDPVDNDWTGTAGRKKLVDADLVEMPAPVDGSDYYGVAVPSVTWTAVPVSNNSASLLIAYDPTGASADSGLIPITHHIFAVTTDGNDVILNVGDFLRAS